MDCGYQKRKAPTFNAKISDLLKCYTVDDYIGTTKEKAEKPVICIKPRQRLNVKDL